MRAVDQIGYRSRADRKIAAGNVGVDQELAQFFFRASCVTSGRRQATAPRSASHQ